ncbi:MAG: homoserine dehydrogenase [Thalassobaculales bacterium]
MGEALRVGIAGLGTVGAGVVRLLTQQAGLLARRCGRPIRLTAVSARDRSRDRGIDLAGVAWHADPVALAHDPTVDVVVELIGGAEGPARTLVEAAIAAGKPVVTANKALLALHGGGLARAAEAAGVSLRFEAAVAGGIPIVKSLREGLAGNAIGRVCGILNGTCNYILSTMRATGRDFAEVLAEAQHLGYAEADPSFDIDGIDTAHKLAVLTALAFGREPDFAGVHVEGIRHVSALDLKFADELGFRIKLLGIAGVTDHGVEQRVHPCMVPAAAPIAQVDGVFNAVVAEGDFVGAVLHQGRGAGGGPTASAVVADLADEALGRRCPAFGVPAASLARAATAPIDHRHGAYYVRLMVVDKPGVIADIAAALRDHAISLESVIQRARDPVEPVPVVLTTHECGEQAMAGALARIAAIGAVLEPPRMIRIESIR